MGTYARFCSNNHGEKDYLNVDLIKVALASGILSAYVCCYQGDLLLNLFSSQVFPRSTFRSLTVCKNGGGRPGPFYHVNDVSVYLGRQRGGGVPDRKNAFRACILRFEPGVVRFHFANVRNSSAWDGGKVWERGYP